MCSCLRNCIISWGTRTWLRCTTMWQLLHKSSMVLIFNDENANERATSSTNLKKCRFYYKYPFLLFDHYCCVWLVRQLLLESPQDLRFIVLKYFEKCVPLGLQIHTKPRCPCPSPSQWLSLSVAWSSSHLFCVVCVLCFSKGILASPASCTIDPPWSRCKRPDLVPSLSWP